MPIKIKCPKCQKILNVAEGLAGKKAACPNPDCKHILSIPANIGARAKAAPAPAPAPAPAKDPYPVSKPVSTEDMENLAASMLADEPQKPTEAPKTIDFNCPMCDEPIKFDVALAGKQAPCPECKRIIKVPKLEDPKKLDWRNAAQKPVGARIDTEPAPEGAWGSTTNRGAVSRDSLEEAGAIPDQRKPLTVRQWIARGLVAAAGLVLLVGGTIFAFSLFGAKKQEAAFKKAVASVSGKDPTVKGPEAGIMHLAIGRYHLGRNEPDSVAAEKSDKGARPQLASARTKLAVTAGSPNAERDALLIEVALAQLDMGGSGKAVDERRRIAWKDVRADVVQTLQAIRPPDGKGAPEGREEAVRLVTRRLIEMDQVKLAEEIASQVGDGPVSPAVAGIEFLRAGKSEAAGNMTTLVLGFYTKGKPADKKTRPSLTIEIVALLKAQGREEALPKLDKDEVSQQDVMNIGKAAGMALLGSGEARGEALKQSTAALKLTALVALADAARDAADAKAAVDEALRLVGGELRDQKISWWVLARLVRLGLAHDLDPAALQSVARRISGKDDHLRGWAELLLFRVKLAGERGKADESLVDDVESNFLCHLLARVELVRHNASKDSGTASDIDKWDDALKPFGDIGVALGLQAHK